MPYYSASFHHNSDLSKAEKEAEKVMEELSIKFKHQYSYPDGSCFKWIDSDVLVRDLENMLNTRLTHSKVELHVDDPNRKPWKVHRVGDRYVQYQTLEEYMKG